MLKQLKQVSYPICAPRGIVNIYSIVFITLVAAFIGAVAQLFFKQGLKRKLNGTRDILGLLKNKMVIVGGVFSVVSLSVYIFALSKAPLSVVYPFYSSIFVFVVLISAAVLKEKFTMMRVAGVLLVILGILLLSLSV